MPILGVIASSGDRNVPDAPTIGTATNVPSGRAYNNGRADVTFTAPVYTGGTPITGYTVTSSPGGFTGTGASSPISVTGLQSNVSYTFTVTATNAVGTSAPSAASNSITATTVPQAPTIGTATDLGTGTTVSVSFTGNATGGSAITGYTATSSPSSITGTGASSPITVSGLTAGTAYTFTVTATNANGTSLPSAASNSVTPQVPSDYELIASFTVSGATSSSPVYISFSGISQSYKHVMAVSNDLHWNTGSFGPIVVVSSTVGDDYSITGMRLNRNAAASIDYGATGGVANYYYYFNTNTTGGAGNDFNTSFRNNHWMTVPNYNDTSITRAGFMFGGNLNQETNGNTGTTAIALNQTLNDTRTSTYQLDAFNWGEYSGGPSPTNSFRDGSSIRLYGMK